MIDKYMSVGEAADAIGCTPGRVRQMLRAGELPGEKLHQMAWLIKKQDVEKVAKAEYKTGRPRSNGR